MDLKEEEKFWAERCYEIINISAQNIHNLSNSINLYIAYGCSFLLIYYFNNLDKLKILIRNKLLFFLIILPILGIIFSLLQLYLNLKIELIQAKFLSEKHNYFTEKIPISNKNRNLLYLLSKLSICVEIFTIFIVLGIFSEIIYIFYKLIFI